jgi:hypothetical protein
VELLRGLLVLSLLGVAGESLGKCGDDPGDAEAVAEARAQVDADCDCAGVPDRATFVRCAALVAGQRAGLGLLPPECRGAVRRCAARSTCGRPGAVTCCIPRGGVIRCRTTKDAARCAARGGTPGTCPSCCDACTTGCAPTSTSTTSTSTTTTTTTSTTTTTLPPCDSALAPQCNGACFPGEVCLDAGGTCFCFANNCSGGSFPQCDGTCPAGSQCFNFLTSCECIPDSCAGPSCRCLPMPLTINSCPSCPPGHTCTQCQEPPIFVCEAGLCTHISECPLGDACVNAPACFP